MRTIEQTDSPWQQTYSEIIDVRSPAEYAEDRIPGAVNLPVLDDEQRAKVGTIYKQVSTFEARKLGAALVSANIAQHLQTHFAAKNRDYSPLVYCWRGGQRSNSMAIILSQIGWQPTVLTGGYKTYRTYVRNQLEQLPPKFEFKVLLGLTGSGKTSILQQLAKQGLQVLDLEALANHRGSLLGQEWHHQPSPQPSQKWFESQLLQQLQNIDPSQPVWVESESNQIGEVHLPNILWQQMKRSSCVEIVLPLQARVDLLLQEYPHLIEHPDILKTQLAKLTSRYGKKQIHHWYSLIDSQQWQKFVADILQTHYDPAYKRSLGQTYQHIAQSISIADLSTTNVATVIEKLALITVSQLNKRY